MPYDDHRLLEKLRLGCEDAYVEVAERFHKEIWAYAYRLCGNSELASDISQETAITIWRSAPQFLGVSALRSWIYKVAHNIYIDHLRKCRLTEMPLEDRDCPQSQDISDSLGIQDALEKALQSLSDDIREAVILTKVQGLTCNEAAVVLDIPSGTVKWRVAQGLKMLRVKLADDLDRRLP